MCPRGFLLRAAAGQAEFGWSRCLCPVARAVERGVEIRRWERFVPGSGRFRRGNRPGTQRFEPRGPWYLLILAERRDKILIHVLRHLRQALDGIKILQQFQWRAGGQPRNFRQVLSQFLALGSLVLME